MQSIFSIDVEDWFNISLPGVEPDPARWDALPSRLETNFRRLLDILAERGATATCFFIAYFAERFPHLVRSAVDAGHEVASHGFAHRLVFTQSAAEFAEDVRKAKQLLEEIAGRPVLGYRAAAFSVTKETPWFFEALASAGYRYDSSIFPAPHRIGGIAVDTFHPHRRETPAGALAEFPITAVEVMGKPMCFFGGGYLRLSPYWLTRRMARRALAEGRPVIFYVHPREIDPAQPRLPMSRKDRFKTYVNLRGTERKLRRILGEFEVTSFERYLAQAPALARA